MALLSWYDEHPSMLRRAIETAESVGCDALVAVDGAYAMLPAGEAQSPKSQRETIVQVAARRRLELILHAPAEPWPTEMAKRTRLFQLGATIAEETDWFLVLDADYELIEKFPGATKARLGLGERAADARLSTPPAPKTSKYPVIPQTTIRCLFRALPGLRVEGNHYTYVAFRDVRLWGNPEAGPLVDALDLTDTLTVVHHTFERPGDRSDRQYDYYLARDASGVEVGACYRCHVREATHLVSVGGPADGDEFEIGHAEVCLDCLPGEERRLAAWGRAAGVDLGRLAFVSRPLAKKEVDA